MRRGGELPGVLGDPRHHGPQGFAKLRRYLGRSSLIPFQRVVEVGPRRGCEQDTQHSSGLPRKLGLDGLPRNGGARVGLESRHAPGEFGLVRGCQADVLGR